MSVSRSPSLFILPFPGSHHLTKLHSQRFAKIKKRLNITKDDSATAKANGTNDTPKSAKSTKNTTPAGKGSGKGRERKAATSAPQYDDEEPTTPVAKKSLKLKVEPDLKKGEGIDPAVDEIGAEVFKAEEEEEGQKGVNLDDDW